MRFVNELDVIVPIFNEEDCLESFYHSLKTQLLKINIPHKIIFVNDGSQDRSQEILLDLANLDKVVQIYELSRNFGHQAAITCGLHASTANWVITMDGDGEHPPEMIPDMIELANKGFDLIQTKRQTGQKASAFKRLTSDAFYHVLRYITNTPILPGVGDFRLINRQVVDALKKLPEHHLFLRGMIAWVGFRSTCLNYSPAQRMGGVSKYSLRKMGKLAMDAIYSFSLVPIILSFMAGCLFIILSFVIGIIGLSSSAIGNWQNLLIFLLLFCTGVILCAIGSVGYYAGLAFQQAKSRPNYIIRSTTNRKQNKKVKNA